jgi:subtilase family serine protease
MKTRTFFGMVGATAIATALPLAGMSGIGGVAGSSAIASGASTVGKVTPAVGSNPLTRYAGKPARIKPLFTCQKPSEGFPCYGPAQIRHAYGFDQLTLDGAGHTIVIVDAFQSPTLRQDLKLFEDTFGLTRTKLSVIAPDGKTPFDAHNSDMLSWSGEISLDVEWAHAIAPAAKIDLVLAKSDDDADINSAVGYAVSNNLGDVISMSFGEDERCEKRAIQASDHETFAQAVAKHITLLASSGDDGSAQPTCDFSNLQGPATSTPASDPLVTAVGGTNLTASLSRGTYQSEQVWNDGFGASGGGYSLKNTKPSYQSSINAPSRAVPDVAYNGGVFGGVLTAWGVPAGPGAFFIFGGTSAGSPQWAGLMALANQKAHARLGDIHVPVYAALNSPDYSSLFNDVVFGDNSFDGFSGFTAGFGYDPATGVGTPRAQNLVPYLAAAGAH